MLDLFAPLFVALGVTTGIAALGSRLHPRHAAWLTAAAVGSVFVTVFVSAWVVSIGYLAHEPAVGALLAWCREPLGLHQPPSRWLGVPAVGVAVWAASRVWRVTRTWMRLRGTDPGAVRVVAADHAIAYAEAGPGGGVVVSTGMLAVLDPAERRAMLVHEQAHLRHRHDRFLVLGSLAAGVPPLWFAVRRLRQALERWADEEAALVVGDRLLVARAVARAALAADGAVVPVRSLSVQGANVPSRVEALMRPPARGSMALLRSLTGLVGAAAAVACAVVQLHHVAPLIVVLCPG